MSTPTFPISPELGQPLALRRVRRGHVVLAGNGLLIDHGRRVPDYIREHLHDLLNDGHLYLGEERAGWAQMARASHRIGTATARQARRTPYTPTSSTDDPVVASFLDGAGTDDVALGERPGRCGIHPHLILEGIDPLP